MAIIGFIGTGEIASAMVNGITNQGHKIYVSKRGIKYAAKLALLNDCFANFANFLRSEVK